MATALSCTVTTSDLYPHLRRHLRCKSLLSCRFTPPPSPPFPPSSHIHRPTFLLLASPGTARCLAVAPGPPSPPGPDPPPSGNTTEFAGLVRAVSRIQDRVKIFLVVLFWMSLFFWASSSDGRGKGKRKKSSRFK